MMKDPVFIERVKSGEDFRIGDLLRVTIETHQSLTPTGLRTRREVIDVIEEIKAPRQVHLLPTRRFPQPPLLTGEKATARPRRRSTASKKKR